MKATTNSPHCAARNYVLLIIALVALKCDFSFILFKCRQATLQARAAVAVFAVRGSARYANRDYRAPTIVPGAHIA